MATVIMGGIINAVKAIKRMTLNAFVFNIMLDTKRGIL